MMRPGVHGPGGVSLKSFSFLVVLGIAASLVLVPGASARHPCRAQEIASAGSIAVVYAHEGCVLHDRDSIALGPEVALPDAAASACRSAVPVRVVGATVLDDGPLPSATLPQLGVSVMGGASSPCTGRWYPGVGPLASPVDRGVTACARDGCSEVQTGYFWTNCDRLLEDVSAQRTIAPHRSAVPLSTEPLGDVGTWCDMG